MKTCPSTPVLIISILSIRVNLPGCRSCRFSTPFSDKGKSSSAFQILHIDHLFHQILRDKLENCDMQNKRNIIKIGRATSELQSRGHLVCRLLLEKKKRRNIRWTIALPLT